MHTLGPMFINFNYLTCKYYQSQWLWRNSKWIPEFWLYLWKINYTKYIFPLIISAGMLHEVQVGICVQRRFKSVCTFPQSDQSINFLPKEMLDPWLPIEHPQTQIRLPWSEALTGAHANLYLSLDTGSYHYKLLLLLQCSINSIFSQNSLKWCLNKFLFSRGQYTNFSILHSPYTTIIVFFEIRWYSSIWLFQGNKKLL